MGGAWSDSRRIVMLLELLQASRCLFSNSGQYTICIFLQFIELICSLVYVIVERCKPGENCCLFQFGHQLQQWVCSLNLMFVPTNSQTQRKKKQRAMKLTERCITNLMRLFQLTELIYSMDRIHLWGRELI